MVRRRQIWLANHSALITAYGVANMLCRSIAAFGLSQNESIGETADSSSGKCDHTLSRVAKTILTPRHHSSYRENKNSNSPNNLLGNPSR